MAYRAEIEIAVRGGKELERLNKIIKATSQGVDGLNDFIKAFGDTVAPTFNNIADSVSKAQRSFDDAISGTKEAVAAANSLTKAESAYNQELQERNRLLNEARARQGPSIRGERLTAPQQQGRESLQAFFADAERQAQSIGVNALNTRTAWSNFFSEAEQVAVDLKTSTSAKQAQIQRNWSVFFGDAAEVAADLQNATNIRAGQVTRSWTKFFGDAAEVAVDLQSAATVRAGSIKQSWTKFFADAGAVAADLQTIQKARSAQINRNWITFFSETADLAADLQASSTAKRLNVKTSWIKFFSEAEQIAKELNAIANTKEAKIKLSWNRFFTDAETVAKDLRLAATSDKTRVQRSWNKFFDQAEQIAKDLSGSAKQTSRTKTGSRKDIVGSALIGGAFPLLFGQGIGAAAGGGIGGAAGGAMGGQMGFALSLVGTQFGAFADQIVGGGAALGQALNLVTADLEAVATAAGFANTEIAESLNVIQELGSEQQALQLATELLAATVGNEGVQALQEFGADTLELSNAFSRAMALMQVAAAQLFGSIAKLAAGAVSDAVDLESGLRNIDDPRLKTLRKKREDLQANDGEGAFVGENTEENLKRIREIDREIIDIVKATRTEVEKRVKAEATGLQNAEALSKFGESDVKRQQIKNSLAKVEQDYTNENFVSLQKQLIQRDKELDLEKASAIVGKDKNGDIKNYGLLAKLNAQVTQNALNEENKLNRKVAKAVEAKNQKTAQGSARLDKQNKQLTQQQQQARAFTANLERQLAQSKVAGSQQAQKLRIEAVYEQTVERIAKLKNQDFAAEQKALADQIRSTALANLEATEAKKQAEAIRSAVAPIKGIREDQEASLAASKEYNRLLMEGVLPSEAKRIVEFNKQVEQLLNQKTEAISLLELDIARAQTNGATTTALQEQLDVLKQQKKAIAGEAAKGPGESDTSDRKTVEDRVAQLQGELTEMTKLGNVAIAVADNIGVAFGAAFQGVINGSKTTQEALSDMLKSVGESFVAMAAEIIVKQLTMIALQAVLKALGGPSFGGGGTGKLPENPLDSFRAAGVQGPIYDFQTKANGGPVSGGQPYMVGERGPELFVPGQSGGVMRNEDMRSLMGRSPASGGAPSMSFSFETTSIGGTEYVSREQLEAAMAVTRKQASNDGAKRGMNMTLDKMQNSPRTRTRIGLR